MPDFQMQKVMNEADLIVDPRSLFMNTQELRWLDDKCGEIGIKYGYTIKDRSGFVAALRMYILGTTEKTLADVVDLRTMSREEFMGYVNGFLDMMDDTKPDRSRVDCIKDLAAAHKVAFRKFKEFKFENLRADNAEYVSKYLGMARVISSTHINYSQNLEHLRKGIVAGTRDYRELLSAYRSVYDEFEESMDEFHVATAVDIFTNHVAKACKQYNEGNFNACAMNLSYLRNNLKLVEGKKIEELPISYVGLGRGIADKVYAYNYPQETDDKPDSQYEEYVNGFRGDFPAQEGAKQFYSREYENNLKMLNQGMSKNVTAFVTGSIEPYVSAFPSEEDIPENLLELPSENIQAVEWAYNETFGKIYDSVDIAAGLSVGLKPWDLIMTSNDVSIKDAVGDKYNDCSIEQKTLAYKLEIMRHVFFDPEGVKLSYCIWKKNNEGKWEPSVSENTYAYKPLVNNLNVDLPNEDGIISIQNATDFIHNPKSMNQTPAFLNHGRKALKILEHYFVHNQAVFKKKNMDMFDCIYVGKQTINEIFKERYEKQFPVMKNSDKQILLTQILLAESFHTALPIYLTNLTELQDGSLKKSIVPITFSGEGLERVPGRQTAPMADRIRINAKNKLDERDKEYRDLEAARKKEFDRAMTFVVEQNKNYFTENIYSRVERIKRRMLFVQPMSRKIFDEIYLHMSGLEAGLIDICTKYDAYMQAAKMTRNPQLKEEFENAAAELLEHQTVKTYLDYVSSLEITYGIKEEKDFEPEDLTRINDLIYAKTGHVSFNWPRYSEYGKATLYYAPLSLQMGPAEDIVQNEKLAEEYIRDTYVTGFLLDDRIREIKLSFGKAILIDGHNADSLLEEDSRGDNVDLKVPENLDNYVKLLAKEVARAIKDGKKVDFYIGRDRQTHLTDTPIHIESSEPAKISEEKANEYRQNQINGHAAMNAVYHFAAGDGRWQSMETRLTENADHFYQKMLKWENASTLSYTNASLLFELKRRLFPEKLKVNAGEGDQDFEWGDALNRETSAVYVIYRLCEEAMAKAQDGVPAYSIDDILSLDKLTEQKVRYAEEFKELVTHGKAKGYMKNLISASNAVVKYLDYLYPPENYANQDPDDFFLGKAGFLRVFFYDGWQYIDKNKEFLVKHGFYENLGEYEQDVKKFADIGSMAKQGYLNMQQLMMTTVGTDGRTQDTAYAPFKYPCALEYTKQLLKLSGITGVPYYTYQERVLKLTEPMFFEELANTEVIRELAGKTHDERMNMLAKGTVLDSVFIDYDKFYRIKNHMETGDINSCVRRVQNKQEKEALERQAISDAADAMEADAINVLLARSSKERAKLFVREVKVEGLNAESKNKLLSKQVFKTIEDLSDDELNEAARMYDSVFGKSMNRDAVRNYLTANPGRTEFDFFKINNQPALNPPSDDIRKNKAQILLYASDPNVILKRDQVRKNGNQYVINGSSTVIGFTNINEFFALESDNISRDSYFINAERRVPANADPQAYQSFYENNAREATKFVFQRDRAIDLDPFEVNDKRDKQDKTYDRIKSLFGPKQKFIRSWDKNVNPIYRKMDFIRNAEDLEVENISEDEFALISYFASTKPECIGIPLNPKTYIRDNASKWTTSFLNDTPDSIPTDMMGDVINAARKAAKMSVDAFLAKASEEEKKYRKLTSGVPEAPEDVENRLKSDQMRRQSLLTDIIVSGIQRSISEALKEQTIADSDNAFYHHAYMLSKVNAFMDKQEFEGLRAKVEQNLSPEEKQNFKAILSLYQLQQNKGNALKKLEAYADGKEQLNDDERKQLLVTVSAFNEYSKLWQTTHQNLAQNAVYHIPQEALNTLSDENALNNKLLDTGNKVNDLFQTLDSMKQWMNAYSQAAAIPTMDNRTNEFLKSPEEIAEISHIKAENKFRIKRAKSIIAEYADDTIIRTAYYNYKKKNREGKISARTLADFKNLSIVDQNSQDAGLYLEEIISELSKEISRTHEICGKVAAVKLPMEELITGNRDAYLEYKRVDEINRLEQNNDPDYAFYLADVKAIIADVKEDFRNYIGEYYNTTNISAAEQDYAKRTPDQLKNGTLTDLFDQKDAYINLDGKKASPYREFYLKQDKLGGVTEIRNHPIKATDEVNNKIKNIIDRMNLHHMIPAANVEIQGEEQQKIYAYRNLMIAKNGLLSAVDSNNINSVMTAYMEYKRQQGYVADILGMIKDAFPNLTAVPGNLDCNRGQFIPMDFMENANAESVMNALYLLGTVCKRHNIAIEDYLNNPFTATEKLTNDRIQAKGFEAHCQEKGSVAAAFNYFENIGDGNLILMDMYGSADAGHYSIRPMEVIGFVEPNQDLRRDLTRQSEVLLRINKTKSAFEGTAAGVIKRFTRDKERLGEKNYDAFRKGIKTALLSGGPLKKEHLPIIDMDVNGIEKPAPNHTQKYEAELAKENNYAAITTMYRNNRAAAASSESKFIAKLLEESIFDYLKAHPEDMEKRAYKDLERIALNAKNDLGIQTNLSAEYQQYKQRFNAKVNELKTAEKTKDDALNEKLIKLQSDLKDARKKQRKDLNNQKNTLEVDRKIAGIETEMKNLIDERLIEMNEDYALKKLTNCYFKARHDQLTALKNDLTNLNYKTIPAFTNPNGPDNLADARLIKKIVEGNLWSGKIKNMSAFKNYMLHELQDIILADGTKIRQISYENELSPDDWQKAYEMAISRYASANTVLPEDYKTSEQLTREINTRIENYRSMETDAALIKATGKRNDRNAQGQINGSMENFYNTKKNVLSHNLQDENDFNQYKTAQNPPEPSNKFYEDVARVIAAGIVKNRGGKIPLGNFDGEDGFVSRIATDPAFRITVKPLLSKVIEQKTAQNAGVIPEQDNYCTKLIELLDERIIVSAYALQKKKMAEAATPEAAAHITVGADYLKKNYLPNQRAVVYHPGQQPQQNPGHQPQQNQGPGAQHGPGQGAQHGPQQGAGPQQGPQPGPQPGGNGIHP